jgi:hypothetical protein
MKTRGSRPHSEATSTSLPRHPVVASLSRWMVKPHQFRVGDLVKVVQVPPRLHDAAGIGAPELFRRALGETLRIDGFGRHGHLELSVLE